MTDTPIADAAADAVATGTTIADPASGQLARRFDPAVVDKLLAPHTVSMEDWLTGIMTTDEFPDQDPEAVTLGMLAAILLAETPDEALSALELERARELCGGEPGGRSPVLEITAARPLASTYEDGSACYVIVTATVLERGERIRFSTGSRAVQTVIWTAIAKGWLPLRCQLEIRREKTKRGFYPLNLVGGI